MKRYSLFILLAGDLVALAVFVYTGQTEHGTLDPNSPLGSVLYETGMFALPWVIAAWLLGAFRTDPRESIADFMANSLNAWLVAGPLAILLRALVMQRENIPTAFLAVAMILAGAFVLGWRAVFSLIGRFVFKAAEVPPLTPRQ